METLDIIIFEFLISAYRFHPTGHNRSDKRLIIIISPEPSDLLGRDERSHLKLITFIKDAAKNVFCNFNNYKYFTYFAKRAGMSSVFYNIFFHPDE